MAQKPDCEIKNCLDCASGEENFTLLVGIYFLRTVAQSMLAGHASPKFTLQDYVNDHRKSCPCDSPARRLVHDVFLRGTEAMPQEIFKPVMLLMMEDLYADPVTPPA